MSVKVYSDHSQHEIKEILHHENTPFPLQYNTIFLLILPEGFFRTNLQYE